MNIVYVSSHTRTHTHTHTHSHVVGPKVTIGDLQVLKQCDKSEMAQRLRIIERTSHKWRMIADRLSDEPNKADTLWENCNNNSSQCLRQLFLDCFLNNKPANNYSQDWSGIVELLEDIGEEQLASEVRDMVTLSR